MQVAFKTVPLGVQEWAIAVVPGLSIFLLETLRKLALPRLFSLASRDRPAPNRAFRRRGPAAPGYRDGVRISRVRTEGNET